jgi:uncharacterized metal-binding protein YceD (DUF177 family)
MSDSAAFILPLKGLGKGLYEYDLRVDRSFLSAFPASPIREAEIDVHLIVDKQSREMVIDVNLSGTVVTNCDRCLATIDLPVAERQQLIVQFTAETKSVTDEGEILYLHPDTNEFNLSPFIYELTVLSVPMIRTFACREGQPPYPCDEDVLDRLTTEAAVEQSAEEKEEKPSPWDVLKDLNNN